MVHVFFLNNSGKYVIRKNNVDSYGSEEDDVTDVTRQSSNKQMVDGCLYLI